MLISFLFLSSSYMPSISGYLYVWKGCVPTCLSLNIFRQIIYTRVKILASLSIYMHRSYFHFLRKTFRHRSSKKCVSSKCGSANTKTRVAFHRSSDVFWYALTHEIPGFNYSQSTPEITFCAREEWKGEHGATNTTDGITHFVSGRGNAAAFLTFRGARSDTLGHLRP